MQKFWFGAFVVVILPALTLADTVALWEFTGDSGASITTVPTADANADLTLFAQNTGVTPLLYSSDVPGAVITDGLNGPVRLNTTSMQATVTDTTYSYMKTNPSTSSAMELSTFTVEAFIKPNQMDAWSSILGYEKTETKPYYKMQWRSGTETIAGRIDTDTGNNLNFFTSTVLTDGEWHHIAFTFDGTVERIYIDYVEEGSRDLTGEGSLAAAYGDSIGFVVGTATEGLFDEVRVSDTALSPDAFLYAVPEPTSLTLLSLGGVVWGAARHRQ